MTDLDKIIAEYLTAVDDILVRTDDEDFDLSEEFLSVDREGEHTRAWLAFGGPNVFLVRDYHGDAIECWWGGDHRIKRSSQVSALLDYLEE